MNYADFVFATLLMLGVTPKGIEPNHDAMQWRIGRNDRDKAGPGKHGVLSVDHHGRFDVLAGSGLKPYVTAGMSGDGLRYVGVGCYKRLPWASFELTPSIGPVLYDSRRVHGTSERFQFRTGLDLHARLPGDHHVGIGFYHLSNAGLSSDTAAVDVSYFSWRWRF